MPQPPRQHLDALVDRLADWWTGSGRQLWRAHAALLVPAIIGAGILALLTWGSGEIYEAVTEDEGVALLDRPALDLALSLRSPGLDRAVTVFTTIGGPIVTPVIAGAIVIALAIHWRSLLPVTLMVAASLGSLAVTLVGKQYIGRVRPPHQYAVPPYEWSPSFPSGHALNSVVISGVIAYLLFRRFHHRWARVTAIVVAAVYSLLMGLSRVFLGHHWLTDVLVGWALGLAWLAVIITAHLVAVAVKQRGQHPAQAQPTPRPAPAPPRPEA